MSQHSYPLQPDLIVQACNKWRFKVDTIYSEEGNRFYLVKLPHRKRDMFLESKSEVRLFIRGYIEGRGLGDELL